MSFCSGGTASASGCVMIGTAATTRELRHINHNHPESKKRKSSEGNSGSISADCKRGRRKGPRQKASKIVKKCQKVFRHFSTIFARHHFAGPFWGPLTIHPYGRYENAGKTNKTRFTIAFSGLSRPFSRRGPLRWR